MTTSSIRCKPGDVVLVWFKFTGLGGMKKRPAVILSVEDYHLSRRDAVMMALSTHVSDSYFGDQILSDWKAAGLPQPTKAKAVVQTIDRSTIERQLGSLSPSDLVLVRESIKKVLGV